MPQRGAVSLDGDAVVSDVATGKTFYSNDPNLKLTGVAPVGMGYKSLSDVVVFTNAPMKQNNSAAYVKLKEILLEMAIEVATIRTYFQLSSSGAGIQVFGRIYKNGAAVGTERSTNSTSYTNYTEDLAFDCSDLYQLYGKGNGTYYSRVQSQLVKGTVATGLVSQDP